MNVAAKQPSHDSENNSSSNTIKEPSDLIIHRLLIFIIIFR